MADKWSPDSLSLPSQDTDSRHSSGGITSGRSRSHAFLWSCPYGEFRKATAVSYATAVVLMLARFEVALVYPEPWAYIRATTRKDFGLAGRTVRRALRNLKDLGLVELDGRKGKAFRIRLITSEPPGARIQRRKRPI